MPVEFSCPSCSTRLRAPDNTTGLKRKCPKCGTMIQPHSPSHDTPATLQSGDNRSLSMPSASVAEEDRQPRFVKIEAKEDATVSCPHCRAQASPTAACCASCGKKLPNPEEAAQLLKLQKIEAIKQVQAVQVKGGWRELQLDQADRRPVANEFTEKFNS
jgi:DNA-directed RNA polymerase subunit RPC12/RpoP